MLLLLAQGLDLPRDLGLLLGEEIRVPEDFSGRIPERWLLLGHVIGTRIPVFIDLQAACEGHLAILGMTKMGKTTLACRLARSLSESRHVVILDRTGEYRAKRGAQRWRDDGQWGTAGVSVHEPALREVGADFAHAFVTATMDIAAGEYERGDPVPRSIFIDEAHQFIPEPAGLGFGAPGRDRSYELGVGIMQLRKAYL